MRKLLTVIMSIMICFNSTSYALTAICDGDCKNSDPSDELKMIRVYPDEVELEANSKYTKDKVSVVAIYEDNSTLDITKKCEFTSSDNDVAYIDSNYYIKSGDDEEDATIKVEYKGEKDYIKVKVREDIDDEENPGDDPIGDIKYLKSIEITPSHPDDIEGFDEEGEDLEVIAHYSDGDEDDVTEDVEWKTEDDDIAYVEEDDDEPILMSGDEEGKVKITAIYEDDGITKKDYIYVEVIEDDDDDDAGDGDTPNKEFDGLGVELRLASEKRKYVEGKDIKYYVDYYNGTSKTQDDVEIEVDFPKELKVADKGKGKVSGSKIKFDVGDLKKWKCGRFEFELEPKSIDDMEIVELKAEIFSDDDEEDSSELEHMVFEKNASGYHKKYIVGYPDIVTKDYRGNIIGNTGPTFRPSNRITRQELAAVMARVLGYSQTPNNNHNYGYKYDQFNNSLSYSKDNYDSYNSYSTYNNYSNNKYNYHNSYMTYKDMCTKHWGYNEVMAVTQQGLFTGYPDGTFRPNAYVSRSEFLVVLTKALNMSGEEPLFIHFDKYDKRWYSDQLELLYRLKIVTDDDPLVKNPDVAITRAEVVTILNRYLYRGPLEIDLDANIFTDINRYHWAYEDIQEAARDHSFKMQSDGEEEGSF